MPVAVYSTISSTSSRLKSRLRKALATLLLLAGKQRAILEISLVGKGEIRKLNKRFRKKDRITDVLSFPQDFKPPPRGRVWHLGEIVIALPVAQAQAEKAQRSTTDQAIRLAVHGLVHLCGLDHERSVAERKSFQVLEKKWLGGLKQKGWLAWDGSLQF